jgi:hypothetical protein
LLSCSGTYFDVFIYKRRFILSVSIFLIPDFKETIKELTNSKTAAVVSVNISFYAAHDSCTGNKCHYSTIISSALEVSSLSFCSTE